MTNLLYQLKNITFNYGTDFNLVDVCVDIERSNVIAIVGPNGSGKTSLLNILSFLNYPQTGCLLYNGKELSPNYFEEFRKTVGYVQQSPYLLRGTTFKNLELGLKLKHIDKQTRTQKVSEVMQLLGITALANRNARTLSGGEAQKVAIGQVLVLEPDVLILDEPFTHLDKDAIHELEQIVLKLKEEFNKTIILTTHNQFQAQWLADDVYSVIKGKVFKSQLVNLFSGALDFKNKGFNTGKQLIIIPEGINHAEHIAIDPKQIVLSNEKLDSSMQNSFQGKITGLTEENGRVKVNIDSDENYQVIVTHKALEELKLSIGTQVWISFKSSSILVF
jgi:tungstate transport system ATP-binding protein